MGLADRLAISLCPVTGITGADHHTQLFPWVPEGKGPVPVLSFLSGCWRSELGYSLANAVSTMLMEMSS